MMEFDEKSVNCRVVGDYVIGSKLGSGSFAVVWKSRHVHTGDVFAVKEIDKKHLNDNLLKEIEILRNVDHPNIIRLFDVVETEEKVYLVLEYCDGGDLGEYIHRYGRVSEDVARHFMKQLATGLQVLRENHLIHRDLKPQNLLLSSKEMTPMLKIGDFGFARYLTQERLAETICGSPLYMAPEIIQNKKYDAKADLWSVGAILYQLVVGKTPFGGNNQLQLFQNILRSTELRFPEGSLHVLNPDCVELCRKLLRQNPVERLTFEEFFNHKFLRETRVADSSSLVSQVETLALTDTQRPSLQQEDKLKSAVESVKCSSSMNDERRAISAIIPNILTPSNKQSIDENPCSSSQAQVANSLDTIEREYVLVHSYSSSMEILTSSLGTSLKETSNTRPYVASKYNDQQNLHPSKRLHLLNQYLATLSNLAQEKFDQGLILESFSVELVVLALWKEAFRISSSWNDFTESSSRNKFVHNIGTSSSREEHFTDPSSTSAWAEQGFVHACDRTETLSKYMQDVDGTTEMPDSIEIIYQTALAAGRNGATDQLLGNQESAVMMYSKALLLFSFIVAEAPSLPLNPPFTLALEVKQRILKYIKCLESHLNHPDLSAISVATLLTKESLPPYPEEVFSRSHPDMIKKNFFVNTYDFPFFCL